MKSYGIRSLSPDDKLFGKGENYWRGKIWANINYMMFSALTTDFFQAYKSSFLKNIMRVFYKQGNFFENFHETSGEGTGASPFTGWTATAFLLLSTNEYFSVNEVVVAAGGK